MARINSWTESEIEVLREEYGVTTNKVLSARLQRSAASIVHMAKKLGLSKSGTIPEDELEFYRQHLEMGAEEMHQLYPHRSVATIRATMCRLKREEHEGCRSSRARRKAWYLK